MKKKSWIYLASTAVLLAATSQQVLADQVTDAKEDAVASSGVQAGTAFLEIPAAEIGTVAVYVGNNQNPQPALVAPASPAPANEFQSVESAPAAGKAAKPEEEKSAQNEGLIATPAVEKETEQAAPVESKADQETPKLEYQAHVQNIGWMKSVTSGELAGTAGQARRMEGLKVKVADFSEDQLAVTYRAHVAHSGWLDWVKSSELAGTTGQSRRMEGIELKLTGSLASQYNIEYRAHVAHLGWLGWVKDGALAGTTGQSRRMEGLQIRIVPKIAVGPKPDGKDTDQNAALPQPKPEAKPQAKPESKPVQPTSPTGNIQVKNNQDGTFDITISDAYHPAGIKSVSLPTWSSKNGQDDIHWYTADKQADGIYKYTVKLSDHSYQSGEYNVHLYYNTNDGKMVGIGGVKHTVPTNNNKETGVISVKNNADNTFDIVISQVTSPAGVKSVSLPTWTTSGGQDDIHWYTADKQADGTYKYSVKLSDHNFQTGEYNVHLYYNTNDGKMVGVGGVKHTVPADAGAAKAEAKLSIVNQNNQAGTFDIVATDVKLPAQVNQLRVGVWRESQSHTLEWYNLDRQADGSYKHSVKAADHKFAQGKYYIDLYAVQNGKQNYVTGTTTQVSLDKNFLTKNAQTAYYSQRDPRWSKKYYGIWNMDDAGCVPTSLAMALTGLVGRTVLPTEVADYLYYHTIAFNKAGIGTATDGIIKVAEHYGVSTKVLHSAQAVKDALAAGHNVYAAVGPSRFVNAPYTHGMMLKGYSGGSTYVRDPYTPSLSGNYSVDYLWGIRSRAVDDNQLGSPFIAFGLL